MRRQIFWGVVAGLLLAVLATVAVRLSWSESRRLVALSARDRTALYARTLQNLKSLCSGPVAPRLPELCRTQAELILKLPECDASCQQLARALLPGPAR